MSALNTSLATLAANAGFPAAVIPTAVAIAMAESSGNSNAIGDKGSSYGLWQINLPAHPEFDGQNLLDAQTNANAAYQVWQAAGESFTPWTTYKSGAYQGFLPAPASSPYAPPTSTLTIPPPAPAPAANSDPWATLAIGTLAILTVRLVVEEI